MDGVILDILESLRAGDDLDAKALDRIVRRHSKRVHDGRRVFAKKHILPYYLEVKRENGERWASWNVDGNLDARFMSALQMKPRRTASGIASVTVITKPWPCKNACVYCPNDPAMPKSYLSDEPACQRAERNRFHPYLQVASRVRTLHQMGHSTDKIELIVLGGTWLDYPHDYRVWFISELFRALNDSAEEREEALARADVEGALPSSENSAFNLEEILSANERAECRVVGLVVETRPDTVTCESLTELRSYGCTKIQLGVQSIDDRLLELNGRRETRETIKEALSLSRLFGFKTHAHFMLNLLGATHESDKRDFETFVHDAAFCPDEVKLYPCALVDHTELMRHYEDGTWSPYSEEELIDVLCCNMKAAPPYLRVSRMIRDISAKDIVAGNKKTNLRQMVDNELKTQGASISEIRFRELGTGEFSVEDLSLEETSYVTSSTTEHFLQWVSPDDRIAGFLRLSLPYPDAVESLGALPVNPGESMIREVHVYGFATEINAEGTSAQHKGLGKRLIERACELSRKAGMTHVNVISSVGTREYYRMNGFYDNGLYQQKQL